MQSCGRTLVDAGVQCVVEVISPTVLPWLQRKEEIEEWRLIAICTKSTASTRHIILHSDDLKVKIPIQRIHGKCQDVSMLLTVHVLRNCVDHTEKGSRPDGVSCREYGPAADLGSAGPGTVEFKEFQACKSLSHLHPCSGESVLFTCRFIACNHLVVLYDDGSCMYFDEMLRLRHIGRYPTVCQSPGGAPLEALIDIPVCAYARVQCIRVQAALGPHRLVH